MNLTLYEWISKYTKKRRISMSYIRRKGFFVFLVIALSLMFIVGCSTTTSGDPGSGNQGEEEVPTIRMAWDFDLHAAVMLSAAIKGEDFKDAGIWLKPIIEKEQYELYKDGEKLAVLNTIVTKGSSESAVMLGQKQLDCALNSVTGMLSAKDQG